MIKSVECYSSDNDRYLSGTFDIVARAENRFSETWFHRVKNYFDTDVVDQLSTWLDELSQKAPDVGSGARYFVSGSYL